jgi:hypothetical protein
MVLLGNYFLFSEFYSSMKRKDDIIYDNLQSKINELVEVLGVVYENVKDNDIYEHLRETTKFYLENTK